MWSGFWKAPIALLQVWWNFCEQRKVIVHRLWKFSNKCNINTDLSETFSSYPFLSCSTNSSFLEDEFYDCQSNVIIPCEIRNQEETSSLVRRITSDSGNESGGVDLDGECSATFGLQVDPRNIEPCRIQTKTKSERTTQREVVYIPFRWVKHPGR